MTVLLIIFHWQWSNQIQMCKAFRSAACYSIHAAFREVAERHSFSPTYSNQSPSSPAKSDGRQVIKEPRVVTSFSEAKFTLPDQYLKPKSSILSATAIPILCRMNLCSTWLQPHRRLWSFSFCRRDGTEAVHRIIWLHYLITWITNYIHYLSQMVIVTQSTRGSGHQSLHGSKS